MKALKPVLAALLALAWSLTFPVQAAQSACDPGTHGPSISIEQDALQGADNHHDHQANKHSDHQCDHGDNCQCPPVCHVPVAAVMAMADASAIQIPGSATSRGTGMRTPAHRWPLIRPPILQLS